MTRREELTQNALRAGLYVATWSPGDGVTRYRFFRLTDLGDDTQTYFGPANGCYTALGLKEAEAFVSGAVVR